MKPEEMFYSQDWPFCPCKKCLVRTMCYKDCSKLLKYLNMFTIITKALYTIILLMCGTYLAAMIL